MDNTATNFTQSGAEFLYEDAGVSGIEYEGAMYIYRKDGQGNISALIDSIGNIVVIYEYDAWGEPQGAERVGSRKHERDIHNLAERLPMVLILENLKRLYWGKSFRYRWVNLFLEVCLAVYGKFD